MTSLTNNYEALVVALALAITAPNDAMAQQCAEMAVQIAERGYMNADEVERAKADALQQVGLSADNRISVEEDEGE
jgi:hypothetical protein